jgi:hypothetical protein
MHPGLTLSRRDRMMVARQFIAWVGQRQIRPVRERCDESLLQSSHFADAIRLTIGIRTPASTVPATTHHAVPYGTDLF